jgi:hypothetical protein
MRQRQDEVLREGIGEREGQLVVVPATVDRLVLEVGQRVVHPAHVPLKVEPQPTEVGRPRDPGPRRRLLRRRDDARLAAVNDLVVLLEEGHGIEVLVTAVLVGHPPPLLARVIEVEHGSHGVDADAVCVVFARPVQGVREQEVAHLVAPVAKDQRSPVRVGAAARVFVLVERGAVEASEREVVARKVRRHPVEDHADAAVMQPVDEVAEVVGDP